jgi:hypothetical protein
MLIWVCLRILASSRIPRYDLGRRNPSFLRWFCHTHSLAAQPSGENDLRGLLQRVRAARDVALARSPAAQRWLAGDKVLPEISRGHRGGAGQGGEGRDTPKRCADGEATQTASGSGVQRRRVAPVVVDECGEVLQLEGDPGVRRRRSIEECSSSEGANRRGGGRW